MHSLPSVEHPCYCTLQIQNIMTQKATWLGI